MIMHDLAIQRELNFLFLATNTFLHDHFLDVVEDAWFLNSDIAAVPEYLGSDEIKINTEEDVFQAIVRWIAVNTEDRKVHYEELLGTVRLPFITNAVRMSRRRL